MPRRFLLPITAVFLVLLGGAFAYAQLQTGEVAGIVVDQNGDPLPGVTVTLEGETVGLAPRVAVTNVNGRFRFAQLAPGAYMLTYELEGFQSLTQTGIKAEVGATQEMLAEMTLGGIEEQVTVTAERPVMDKKKTGLASELGEEYLENVPTSRDPWMTMSLVPGVQVDRVNVGGTESGQQANFIGHGSRSNQSAGGSAQWTWDGIVITDMAATGSSPMYYDFDSIAELNVQTAGHDVETPFGNVGVNFVTKQGGDTWRGQASFYGTNESFQSNNTPTTDEFAGVATNRVNNIRDWGFDVGGPIVQGRAWLWGAFRTQDIAITALSRNFEPPTDKTTLENWNFKVHGNITPENKATFSWARGNKIKLGRGASARRPQETTWDQDGPTSIYKLEDQHIFSDNFLMSGSYGYVGGGFQLVPKGGNDTAIVYDLATRIAGQSWYGYATDRPQHQLRADGNAFLAETLGADHELKFGFIYRDTDTNSALTYGNGNWLYPLNGAPYFVSLIRGSTSLDDPFTEYSSNYTGFYVGDTISKGRMTLNFGGRVDVQTAAAGEVTLAAHPVVPNILVESSFPGVNTDTDWIDFSPRIGATFDLFDDGKTLLKGNFAYYASQRDQGNPDRFLNFASTAGAGFLCFHPACASGVGPTSTAQLFDANGDGRITSQIFPTGDIFWFWGFDPNNPTLQRTINTFDPDLGAPESMEFVVGVQQEITRGIAVGANVIWRKNDNLLWFPDQRPGGEDFGANPGAILTPADFVQRTVDGVSFFDLTGTTVGAGFHTENRPAYEDTYLALELRAQKRLSDNWMADVSLTLSDWEQSYNCFNSSSPTQVSGDVCYQDPTNVAFLNDQWIYQETSASGKTDVWMGSRWFFKASGTYMFPYGMNVSGVLLGREGTVFPPQISVESAVRTGGIGGVNALTEPFGESRLPNLWTADLSIQKETQMGQNTSVTLVLDAFNIFNTDTLLGKEILEGNVTTGGFGASTVFETPLEILAPRIFRIGIVLNVGE